MAKYWFLFVITYTIAKITFTANNTQFNTIGIILYYYRYY